MKGANCEKEGEWRVIQMVIGLLFLAVAGVVRLILPRCIEIPNLCKYLF